MQCRITRKEFYVHMNFLISFIFRFGSNFIALQYTKTNMADVNDMHFY